MFPFFSTGAAASGGGLADGDYGDVTVSGSGAVIELNNPNSLLPEYTSDAGTAGGDGATIAIIGGAGDDTGNGAEVIIRGGASGGGAEGNGGALSFEGGAAVSDVGHGGDISFVGGVAVGNRIGGSVSFTTGNSDASGTSGSMNFTVGDPNGGAVGSIIIDGNGGEITLTSDGAQVSFGGSTTVNLASAVAVLLGGNLSSAAGTGGGAGTDITITGGAGDGTGAGAAITITSGESGGGATGNGGEIQIQGGNSAATDGNGASVSVIGGDGAGIGGGGNLTIGAGASGGASGTAGGVTISAGSASGGTAGHINLDPQDGYVKSTKPIAIMTSAAPADGDIVAGQAFWWYDDDNVTPAIMFKAKTANGTVVDATVLLT